MPFDQCVSMSSDGRSFYNQGVSPCESVVITQYNLSDCAGKAVGRFAMGQYECRQRPVRDVLAQPPAAGA